MLQAPISDRKTKSEASSKTTEHLLDQEQPTHLSGWMGRSRQSHPLQQRENLAAFQKAYGNQAVLRMRQGENGRSSSTVSLLQRGVLQRKCACGDAADLGGLECQQKQKSSLQRKAQETETGTGVPPIVHEVLRSPGHPLDSQTQTFMESLFNQKLDRPISRLDSAVGRQKMSRASGNRYEQEADRVADFVGRTPEIEQDAVSSSRNYDFSQVLIYRSSQAADAAQSINSLAYTIGQKIVFDDRQYAPTTQAGQRLLAHELTHTIQQADISNPTSTQVQRAIEDGNNFERESGGDSSTVDRSNITPNPATPSSSTTKCNTDNFFMNFNDWDISWPWTTWPWTGSGSTTIRLPATFRVDLSLGSKKSDCLIGQRKKGYVEGGGGSPDNFPSWTVDGAVGQAYWWDGSSWYGGNGSWDWFGKDGADFYDKPGFPSAPRNTYPLYYGGVGKSGSFQFETFIADKDTLREVNKISWSMLIDYKAPESGSHTHS